MDQVPENVQPGDTWTYTNESGTWTAKLLETGAVVHSLIEPSAAYVEAHPLDVEQTPSPTLAAVLAPPMAKLTEAISKLGTALDAGDTSAAYVAAVEMGLETGKMASILEEA